MKTLTNKPEIEEQKESEERTNEEVSGLVSNKEIGKREGTELPENIRNTLAQIIEIYHGNMLQVTSVTGLVLRFLGCMVISGSLLALSDHKKIALTMVIVGVILVLIGFVHKKSDASGDTIKNGDFIYFESTINQVKTPTPSNKIFYTVEDVKTVPLLDADSDSLREGSSVICIYTGKGCLCTDKEFHNIMEYEKVNGR